MYRKFKEHKDPEYETIIKKQVDDSKIVAEQEGITIPKTLDDYVAPSKPNKKTLTGGISRDDEDETDSMLGSENGNNLSENDDDEEYMEDEEDEGR